MLGSGFLKVYVSYVSQSNFCQLFFFAKKIQSSEDMGSSPVRLAGEVVSARQEVLQVQEVAAKKRNRNKWEK